MLLGIKFVSDVKNKSSKNEGKFYGFPDRYPRA